MEGTVLMLGWLTTQPGNWIDGLMGWVVGTCAHDVDVQSLCVQHVVVLDTAMLVLCCSN